MITSGISGSGQVCVAGHTSVVSLVVNDMTVLRACYMPFLLQKGLFVPSQQIRSLGQRLFLIVRLVPHEVSAAGMARVCWITPEMSGDGRTQGYGLHFDPEADRLRSMIESALAADPVKTSGLSHTL